MRIAHISFHFAEYALNLSRALAERHNVLTILGRENVSSELVEPLERARVGNLWLTTMRNFRLIDPRSAGNAIELGRAITRFQPHVVHCQEAPTDYLIAAWPVIGRFPITLTIHDVKPHSGADSQGRWRIERYRSFLRRRADAVIVHGAPARAEAEGQMPWLKGRIFSAMHGPIGQGADFASAGKPDWVPGRLLLFGRIEAYKGLGGLLDALDILWRAGRTWTLCVAGRGSDLEQHRSRILNSPHCQLIERFIRPDEIASLFRAAQIIVLPYLDATQSGIAAMALSYGRPAVATSTGSIPELVRQGVNGFLVPPADPHALATAIDRLLSEPETCERFAKNARDLAETEVSWRNIASNTTKVYRAAIKHRHRGL